MHPMLEYTLHHEDPCGARNGTVTVRRPSFETPVFMPVATQGSVKALTQAEVAGLGAKIILGNAYHLYLRPGLPLLQQVGGLSAFMNWPGATLTDSGGYQVFSLAPLLNVSEDGVSFRSHIDGSEHLLTPESATEIQHGIGADIIMAFDQPVGYPATYAQAQEATERSDRCGGAVHCDAHGQVRAGALRHRSRRLRTRPPRSQAARLKALPFDGYAIGGLSVGEPKEVTFGLLAEIVPQLPIDKPRYLMGVGTPAESSAACSAAWTCSTASCPPRRAQRHGQHADRQGEPEECEIRRRPWPPRSGVRLRSLPAPARGLPPPLQGGRDPRHALRELPQYLSLSATHGNYTGGDSRRTLRPVGGMVFGTKE